MWVKEDVNGSTQPLVVLSRNNESLRSISEETKQRPVLFFFFTLYSIIYAEKPLIIPYFVHRMKK